MKGYRMDTDVLRDAALFEKAYASVPAWRQRKIDRLRTEEGKRQSLGAALLLQAAMRDAGLSEKLPVALSKNGKAYFPDVPSFHFNLSHSGHQAICVVAEQPVGCDIQEAGTVRPAVVKKCLAPEEYEAWQAFPPEEQGMAFLKYWTLKESAVKLLGRGLTYDIATLVFAVDDTPRLLAPADFAATFRLEVWEDTVVAVCTPEKEPEWQWTTIFI